MRKYTCWALAWREGDQWVAQGLDFNVVTQGNTPTHAMEMLYEAVAICIADDLNHNLDPEERRAPDECWEPFWELAEHGERFNSTEALDDAIGDTDDRLIGFQFAVILQQRSLASQDISMSDNPSAPPLSLLAAEDKARRANC